MKVREIRGCGWPRWLGLRAITLYPFIFFRERQPPAEIVTHERIHAAQIRRDGAFRFYASHLGQYLRGRLRGMGHQAAYRTISYEVEAYAHQGDAGYPQRIIA